MYPKVCLRKGEEHKVSAAPWFYDNQFDWKDDLAEDGCVADAITFEGKFIARGFFNSRSKIAFRIISQDYSENVDAQLIKMRIQNANKSRTDKNFSNSYRVVFGDSDGLPGLTIDKFGAYLSFQIASLGMERFKQDIIDTLVTMFQPMGIMERNDLPVREKEGLLQKKGCVYGNVPEKVIIYENQVKMYVDLLHGQKTGYFLDQQLNRSRLKEYVRRGEVLDLCCCNGGFSIHAASFGAKCITAVDVSQTALQNAAENAHLNGFENISFLQGDVFEILRDFVGQKRHFDTVILDPPAFAKNKQAAEHAYRGYKELNLQAMKLVSSGGFLFTFSCSQPMTPPLFLDMLKDAAKDCGRRIILLDTLLQSPDHPVSLLNEQSLYLKGYILQIF